MEHPILRALAIARSEKQVMNLLFSPQAQESAEVSSLPSEAARTLRKIREIGRASEAAGAADERPAELPRVARLAPLSFTGWKARLTRRDRKPRAHALDLDKVLVAPPSGGVDSRVASLTRKLKDLILVAEEEHQSAEARRRVRLAEEGAEVSSEPGQGEAERAGQGVDLEALASEVFQAVKQERESRRHRCAEESHGNRW
jgi:hypothetical protein